MSSANRPGVGGTHSRANSLRPIYRSQQVLRNEKGEITGYCPHPDDVVLFLHDQKLLHKADPIDVDGIPDALMGGKEGFTHSQRSVIYKDVDIILRDSTGRMELRRFARVSLFAKIIGGTHEHEIESLIRRGPARDIRRWREEENLHEKLVNKWGSYVDHPDYWPIREDSE